MIYKFWLSRKEREQLDEEESIRKGKALVEHILFGLWSPLTYRERQTLEDWGVLDRLGDIDAENIWEYRPK